MNSKADAISPRVGVSGWLVKAAAVLFLLWFVQILGRVGQSYLHDRAQTAKAEYNRWGLTWNELGGEEVAHGNSYWLEGKIVFTLIGKEGVYVYDPNRRAIFPVISAFDGSLWEQQKAEAAKKGVSPDKKWKLSGPDSAKFIFRKDPTGKGWLPGPFLGKVSDASWCPTSKSLLKYRDHTGPRTRIFTIDPSTMRPAQGIMALHHRNP